MELSRVILGSLFTEKSERLKATGARHTYTLRVAHSATKIEIKQALKKFYDLEVSSVRVLWIRPKTRTLGKGTMEKRHRTKKALVTAVAKSKALDLASFKAS